MSASASPRIAIIGAGMAGITCAHRLQQGFSSVIFEKSRGIGGRLATRRSDGGDHYDHGAQFVTARDPAFVEMLQTLQQADAAAPWSPRLPAGTPSPEHAWWIGTPGMSALLKPLATPLEIRLRATVTALHRKAGAWVVQLAEHDYAETFDAVVITAPAPQARVLLGSATRLGEALDGVAIAPCWAGMFAFAAPWQLPFDAARFDTGPISWIAREASRPGRVGTGDRWVVHASAEWSAAQLERSPDDALALLRDALAHHVGMPLPALAFAQAHRWRYAMTTRPLGQPFLADEAQRLWLGGDWCLGARVESAFHSGGAIARSLSAAF